IKDMKIQYCSDLHIEFPENSSFLKQNPIEAAGDILILAGDIVPFAVMQEFDWFFDDLSGRFNSVYWIPGNHEYYHSDINRRSGSFIEEIRSNVFLLNNQVIEIKGCRMIFSTLWTEISERNRREIAQRLSDFRVISNNGETFTPFEYNALHRENLEFIEKALSNKNEDKCTIVATHHIPTFLNYPEKYRGDTLNEAFAVELFSFIEEYVPDYWIFGHHHSNPESFKIGNTRLLTNQLGYVRYREYYNYSNSATFIP
ncbi:MAG: metallophosphoesterase, partial [Bacteroidota bacterium]